MRFNKIAIQQPYNPCIRSFGKFVCCISIVTNIMPRRVCAFYTIPIQPQAGIFRMDNLARSVLLEDKTWSQRRKYLGNMEKISAEYVNHPSYDAKSLIQQAWKLQTGQSNYSGATALYEEALKLNPQLARQTSMTMWSEAWGLENIRGYPGEATRQAVLHQGFWHSGGGSPRCAATHFPNNHSCHMSITA